MNKKQYYNSIILIFAFLIFFKTQAQEKKQESEEIDKIVFMGNSITEFWPKYSNLFFLNPSYINKGVSGQTTTQMLKRFKVDVINEKPNSVVILAGINDIARNTGPISIKDISKNIIKMSNHARTNNINVIICSVLPAKYIPWNRSIKDTRRKIKSLNLLLYQYCEENKIIYLDYYSEMVDTEGGLKAPEYTSYNDLVHPNKMGYKKMEEILLNVLK